MCDYNEPLIDGDSTSLLIIIYEKLRNDLKNAFYHMVFISA